MAFQIDDLKRVYGGGIDLALHPSTNGGVWMEIDAGPVAAKYRFTLDEAEALIAGLRQAIDAQRTPVRLRLRLDTTLGEG
jgi:hypothetical protein